MSPGSTGIAVSINPATGEVLAEYPFADEAGLAELLARSVSGYQSWRAVSLRTRCAVLMRMADLLDRDTESLAQLMTSEMGKPISQSRGEVTKTASALRWYAHNGPGVLADERTTVNADTVVRYEPLGSVLSVQPWNFPVWQPMRAAMAIMLSGNSYLLKPAPNVVGSALALERLWADAGAPDGVFGVLNAEPDLVAVAIADPAVAAVTVTGSVGAGSAVGALAGRHVKKSVLELGGSDPFIVLADADLDVAVKNAVTARFQNSGQVCIAAKRFILDDAIADDFTARFVAAIGDLRVGDPADEATDIGPLARADLRAELHGQVCASIEAGAALLSGGDLVDGPGFYYQPTVLADVTPGVPVFDDETFGPVAALVRAGGVDDAVRLANTSKYGLSASIWTRDIERARGFAGRLDVGGVFINSIPKSDPRIPIGGVRHSGYGRELSHFGVREFTNAKTLWSEG